MCNTAVMPSSAPSRCGSRPSTRRVWSAARSDRQVLGEPPAQLGAKGFLGGREGEVHGPPLVARANRAASMRAYGTRATEPVQRAWHVEPSVQLALAVPSAAAGDVTPVTATTKVCVQVAPGAWRFPTFHANDQPAHASRPSISCPGPAAPAKVKGGLYAAAGLKLTPLKTSRRAV